LRDAFAARWFRAGTVALAKGMTAANERDRRTIVKALKQME
jgi:hypothetical protein